MNNEAINEMQELDLDEMSKIEGGDGEWMWWAGSVVLGGVLIASGVGAAGALAAGAYYGAVGTYLTSGGGCP